MREFFRQIVHELEAGGPAVLVTLLESDGSTPRGTGAMMAVFSDGRFTGTIGGGNVEFQSQKLAAEMLTAGEGDLVRSFRFVQGNAASLGMVCGGGVTVQFQYLAGGDRNTAAIFRALVTADGKNQNAWFLRRLDGGAVRQMAAADGSGILAGEGPAPAALPALLTQKPVQGRDGWFSVPAARAGRAYLFGGGHVSRALVGVIASVGFRPVVYDDREEFANPALFPAAEGTLCGPFTELGEKVRITPDDYVVIMTRGHQADYEVLTQTLRSGAAYIGCIGSQRKLELCRERLMEAGFTPEEYARVHAPIGLAIGAVTPEEIAVAVAAEMIAVRAGAPRPMSPTEKNT